MLPWYLNHKPLFGSVWDAHGGLGATDPKMHPQILIAPDPNMHPRIPASIPSILAPLGLPNKACRGEQHTKTCLYLHDPSSFISCCLLMILLIFLFLVFPPLSQPAAHQTSPVLRRHFRSGSTRPCIQCMQGLAPKAFFYLRWGITTKKYIPHVRVR